MSAAGPQSMAEVCTTSGAHQRRRWRGVAVVMGLSPAPRPPRRSEGIAKAFAHPPQHQGGRANVFDSTSTVPGKPCRNGIATGTSDPRRHSTRIIPSRASSATLVTVAARLPYCADGKPSRRSRTGWPGCTRPKATAGKK